MSSFLSLIIITEILFNPVRDGYDFVECYNSGIEAVDLSALYIANRNQFGEVAGARPISRNTLLVQPGQYFVLTSNEKWLRLHYNLPDSIIVCQVSSFPSFPDDHGAVVLLDASQTVIDEVQYSVKWHHPLVANAEGVSLERIDYHAPSQNPNNWTSASSSSGYGTPGFQNSHFRASGMEGGEVVVQPRLFSPNNDGQDDFVTIIVRRPESGWMANAAIYDVAGRRIKHLIRNEVLGQDNRFTWYGTDDRSRPVAPGIYLLLTELYSGRGSVRRFKSTIIISSGGY